MRWLVFVSVLGGTTACLDRGDDTSELVDCSTRPFGVAPPRAELDGVWDAARGRMVFFGGDQGVPVNCQSQTSFTDETWAFHPDCDNFEQLEAENGPSARGRHAVALDPVRNRMLVHGGRSREGTSGTYTLYNDLWAFDLENDTWTELDGSGGPSKRSMHVAAIVDDVLYLHGGSTSTNGASYAPKDDLWALDLQTGDWTEIDAPDGPSPRQFHAMVASDDGSTLYAYGGGDENAFLGPFLKDLWALDLSTLEWGRLHRGRSDAPLARIWPDMLYDQDRLVLWSGHDDGALGNTSEVWEFSLGDTSWTQLEEGDVLNSSPLGFCDFPADFTEPDLEGPERRYAGVAVKTGEGEMLVYGGKTDCGIINDVWGYDLGEGAWTERSSATSGEICARAFAECESLCF